MPKALIDYLEYTGTTPDDYDSFIMHQANEFILKQIIRKLKLNKESVPVSLDRYGNTGGVSIPLTLCDTYGIAEDHGKRTINVLMCGFGIGLSSAIEIVQLVSHRGLFELDDIIHNTLGTILGYLILLVFQRLTEQFKYKE